MPFFNITVNTLDINRFGRTVQHIPSANDLVIMYRSLSLTQPVAFNFITSDVIIARAPTEFFSTYNPNLNTSYFEMTFLAPSGSNASVSFAVEYFGMLN